MTQTLRRYVRDVFKVDLPDLLATRPLASGVVMLASGAVGGHAIFALATPLISRLYTPQDFAVIGVFASLLSLLVVVSDGSYGRAIPLPESDRTGACVLLLSACTVVVISVATGIGVALLNDRLAEWTRTPELGHYLWLLPALTLGAGLYQVCGFWAIRRQAYSVLAKTRVEVNVGQAIVTVGLGVTMVGGVGLIVGKAVGTAIGAARLGAFVWRRDSAIARGITGRQVRGVATRYARFPLVAMPAMFLQSLQTKASVLLVAALYGPHAAGSLTFALGVIWVLTTVISDAVAQVYLGRAAEMARQNPEQLDRLFKRTVAGLLKIVAPPLALLGVVSPQLFTAIFGSEWLEAGLYLRSLMAAVIARLVIAVIFQTLTILERQAWVFLTNAAGVGLTAGALVASHHIGWTAEQAIVAYSASLVITYGALFVMARRTIGRAQHAFREDEPSTL